MSEYIMEFPAFDSDGWESDKDKWHTQAELKEQIVRCRDCKWNDPKNEGNWRKYDDACFWFEDYEGTPSPVYPDGFCSWGERRNDV